MSTGCRQMALARWLLLGVSFVMALPGLSACGGPPRSDAARPAAGRASFPPLPEDGPAAGSPHKASGIETLLIDGKDEFLQDSTAADVPTGLRLSAPAGGVGWAIYQVPGLNIERYVTGVDLSEAAVTGSYWIALGNYSLGRWDILKESSLSADSFNVADAQAAISPGGNLYFALIVSGSTIVHQQATIHLQDNAPPALPAPAGLLAVPGDGQVTLSWDSYTAAGATALNAYQSEAGDMSGALLAGNEVLPGDDNLVVTGLTNSTLYYFALKATDGAAESAYSNIVFAVPNAPPAFQLGGIWGRMGYDAAGTSQSPAVGPADFSITVGVDLTSNKSAGPCRTSPVVDSQGNVYALSRDGVFSSWTGDLGSNRFSKDLATIGSRGAQQIPPQAPCVDAADNVYFASVDSDTGGLVFWGFSAAGIKLFDKDYPGGFSGDSDNDQPFPSLNIAEGLLVSASDHYQCPLALNADGSEAWRITDYKDKLEFNAEPAYQSATGAFETPVTVVGISIDPRRHWMSLASTDGAFLHDYKALGGLANLYGGIALPGGQHYYPEYGRLVLLDSASGALGSEVDLGMTDNSSGSPALDATGEYIYQPVYQNAGIVILGKLFCYKVNSSIDPPQLEYAFSQSFFTPPITGRPAVDSGNHVWFADEEGRLYRLSFNPALPVDGSNPTYIWHEMDNTDTYKFSSFALANGGAYICSEQNKLYVVGNPFLD